MTADRPAVIDRRYSWLQISFDLLKIFRHVDLFQSAATAHDAMHRQRIEKLVRKNASRYAARELVNPADVITLEEFLLATTHRRTPLENHVGKSAALQDIAGKESFAGTEFNHSKCIERRSPLLELFGEQLSEDGI